MTSNSAKQRTRERDKKMTNVYADSINAIAANVKSAKNKKDAQALILKVVDKKTLAMLKAQKVDASDFSDLYTVTRVVKFFNELSNDKKVTDKNMFVAVKTLINASAIDETVTRVDLQHAITDIKSDKARAHVYKRATQIDADRQVQMTFAALKISKMLNAATLKANDCKALTLAKEKLENAVI